MKRKGLDKIGYEHPVDVDNRYLNYIDDAPIKYHQ